MLGVLFPSLQKALTSSFHAMDDMLRSPEHERQLLALKQARSASSRRGSLRLTDPSAGGQNDLERRCPVTVSIPWPPGATCSAVLLRHWGSFLVVGLLLRLRHWHMRTALGPCGLSFAVSCYVSGSSSGSDSEDGRVEDG